MSLEECLSETLFIILGSGVCIYADTIYYLLHSVILMYFRTGFRYSEQSCSIIYFRFIEVIFEFGTRQLSKGLTLDNLVIVIILILINENNREQKIFAILLFVN